MRPGPGSAARPREVSPRYARPCRATRPRQAGHEAPPAGRGARSATAGSSWLGCPCRPSATLRRGRRRGSSPSTSGERETRRGRRPWTGLPVGGAGTALRPPNAPRKRPATTSWCRRPRRCCGQSDECGRTAFKRAAGRAKLGCAAGLRHLTFDKERRRNGARGCEPDLS